MAQLKITGFIPKDDVEEEKPKSSKKKKADSAQSTRARRVASTEPTVSPPRRLDDETAELLKRRYGLDRVRYEALPDKKSKGGGYKSGSAYRGWGQRLSSKPEDPARGLPSSGQTPETDDEE